MLENNASRLMFAAIAVVIGGVIYGTVNAAYPEATNQLVKKIQAPFDDSNNSDANVTVSQYAQKTLNVYVPYAIVPGKGILTPTHDKTWLGYDYAYTYSMKDSSFIMDKYNVHNKYGGMYSEYSLNGTNSYTDANGNNVSQVGFYDQADIAPLLQNGKLSNVKMPKSATDANNGTYAFTNTPDNATSIWVTNVSNNTGRQGSLNMDKQMFNNGSIDTSSLSSSYTIGQDGNIEKTSDFISSNHVIGNGPFISWQMPEGAILNGWTDDDYTNTTAPKDSSIDGFYILNANLSSSDLAPLIKKNNLSNDSKLQYVGKLHINFHFVDVGYDKTAN